MSNPLRRPTPVAPWQDPAAQPFLRIQNVTKTYGKVYACDDVSLDIYQGELFALLGGSGSGKSTLLRILAGLVKPDRGSILIDGVDISALPPYERPVNMMFQSYALFPHLDIWENIAFGLKREGLPKAEVQQRVDEMLALVQLTPYARRKPHQLSGGQQQRVAVARAIAGDPLILLADEPTGNLDSKNGEAVMELLRELHQGGATICMVTHDPRYARHAERTVHLFDGQIVKDEAVAAELQEAGFEV